MDKGKAIINFIIYVFSLIFSTLVQNGCIVNTFKYPYVVSLIEYINNINTIVLTLTVFDNNRIITSIYFLDCKPELFTMLY